MASLCVHLLLLGWPSLWRCCVPFTTFFSGSQCWHRGRWTAYLIFNIGNPRGRQQAQVGAGCQKRTMVSSGLVTDSILLFWLFTIKDLCKKVCDFINTQSRFALAVFDGVRDLCALRLPDKKEKKDTWRCPFFLCSSTKKHTRRAEGPWRALYQLKKSLKGPKMRWGSR